jgi:quinol monooxygenase YgiN
MVGIIATARVKDGEGPRFKEVARGLVEAALEFHTGQDYLRTVGPALFELLDGPPDIVRFDEI